MGMTRFQVKRCEICNRYYPQDLDKPPVSMCKSCAEKCEQATVTIQKAFSIPFKHDLPVTIMPRALGLSTIREFYSKKCKNETPKVWCTTSTPLQPSLLKDMYKRYIDTDEAYAHHLWTYELAEHNKELKEKMDKIREAQHLYELTGKQVLNWFYGKGGKGMPLYFDEDAFNGIFVFGLAGIKVDKVIFNYPATIVYWSDGTKTVVHCREDETFDKEEGLVMAICKKALGNKGNFNNVIKKLLKDAVVQNDKQPEKSNMEKLNDVLDHIIDDIDKGVVDVHKEPSTDEVKETVEPIKTNTIEVDTTIPDPMGSGAGEVKDEYPDGGF